MRKRSIALTRSSFDSRIADLSTFFTTTWKLLPAHPVANFNYLAEVVFHSAYVSFESFVSEIFVGYINSDARTFLLNREAAIRKELSPRYDAYLARLTFTIEKNVPVADILRYVDPEGRNITFKTSKDLVKRAQTWLPKAAADKFSKLPSHRLLFVDAARAIRNCVAHRSAGSYKRMNDTLSSLPSTGVCVALRRGGNQVSDVGAYLRALSQGRTRCEIVMDELRSIATALS